MILTIAEAGAARDRGGAASVPRWPHRARATGVRLRVGGTVRRAARVSVIKRTARLQSGTIRTTKKFASSRRGAIFELLNTVCSTEMLCEFKTPSKGFKTPYRQMSAVRSKFMHAGTPISTASQNQVSSRNRLRPDDETPSIRHSGLEREKKHGNLLHERNIIFSNFLPCLLKR